MAGGRKTLWGALLAAAFAAGCSGSAVGDELPYTEDFSACGEEWTQVGDEDVQLGCSEGQYRIYFKSKPSYRFTDVGVTLEKFVESIGLEADISVHAAPTGQADGAGGVGLTCPTTTSTEGEQQYVFFVLPHSQSYHIHRVDRLNERVRVLVDGPLPSQAIAGVGGITRMRAECRQVGDQAELTMWLNGEQVARATDRHGLHGYIGFGFVAISPKAGEADFRYDNLSVEELD